MTEDEARAALRAFIGIGDVESWIAVRPWKAAPGGWTVAGELQGWRFRLEVMPGGVRVLALKVGGGDPARGLCRRARGKGENAGCGKPATPSPAARRSCKGRYGKRGRPSRAAPARSTPPVRPSHPRP